VGEQRRVTNHAGPAIAAKRAKSLVRVFTIAVLFVLIHIVHNDGAVRGGLRQVEFEQLRQGVLLRISAGQP